MTLRLILIRHAKSSWDDPTLDDHDRRLNARGRAAADAIGGWLAGKGYQPDAVLSSTARRTVETWQGLAPHLNPDTEVEFSSGLYHASPQAMLTALGRQSRDTVLLLGHNPGTAGLAAGLVSKPVDHAAFDRYPTAATAVLDFDADNWKAIRPGTGDLVDFVVPRDLA
ncbi:SixA phosphatase family protein [Aliiroseovarius sp. YM-037]|uniref:SixA phosphatase family protein n=1 Tax=Aliiroseovarius sp. YM-037 TaxID=3341728 RepID=UPI003A80EC7E